MKNILQTIENNYKVNEGRYLTYYENKEDVITECKEMDREISEFEYKFDVNLNEVKFPAITFDEEDSPDSGTILDSRNNREDILCEAFRYFEPLNDVIKSHCYECDAVNVFDDMHDVVECFNCGMDTQAEYHMLYDPEAISKAQDEMIKHRLNGLREEAPWILSSID